jgi:hypothetical protein
MDAAGVRQWQVSRRLTAEILYVRHGLYTIAERGDRLIAATAVALDLALITRDPQLAAAAGVECLWGLNDHARGCRVGAGRLFRS